MSHASLRGPWSILLLFSVAGCGSGGGPGSPHYLATLTVYNRTIAEVQVSSGEGGQRAFTVPACGEVTQPNFPVNWWWLGSEGRNTFHSGGGINAAQSFIVVTSTPTQSETRPVTLPACTGLLQEQ